MAGFLRRRKLGLLVKVSLTAISLWILSVMIFGSQSKSLEDGPLEGKRRNINSARERAIVKPPDNMMRDSNHDLHIVHQQERKQLGDKINMDLNRNNVDKPNRNVHIESKEEEKPLKFEAHKKPQVPKVDPNAPGMLLKHFYNILCKALVTLSGFAH